MSYSIGSIINNQEEFNGHIAFRKYCDDDDEMREVEAQYYSSETDTESTDMEDDERQSSQATTSQVKVEISPEKAPLANIFNRQIDPNARIGDLARLHGFLAGKVQSEYSYLENRDQTKATAEQSKARNEPNGSQGQLEFCEREKQYRNRQRTYACQREAVGMALDDVEQLLANRAKVEKKNQYKLQEQNSIPLAGKHINIFSSFG